MGNFSLDITDFQSISSAHVDFEQGINLIVGQSNSGKTAILRAIDSVLTNPTYAKTFVKHNTGNAEVSFNYEGNDILWNKSAKGAVTYNVNGQEYSKMGTQDLFSILPDNGFVKSDNGEVMNIEGEWDLPFPFDRTPSELFRLFENVFCVSDSATILKSFKEEESDLVKQISDTKDKIKRSNNKLTALNELEAEAKLNELKAGLSVFECNAQEYFDLLNDYEAIKRSEGFGNFVIDEVTPPTQDSLTEYGSTKKDLEFVVDVAQKIKFYKTLPEVMKVPNTVAEYKELFEDINVIDNGMLAENFMVDKKIEITGENLETYFKLREDLEEINKGYAASKFNIDKSCIEDTSLSLAEYTSLSADLKEIVGCFHRCKELTQKCKDLNVKIEEIDKKLKEYKVCPLCGQELGKGHEHVK